MNQFVETKALPHFWCEGCGNGIVLGALCRALERTGKKLEKTVVVTGIGCTGKLDDYVSCHTVHGTHGRALSIATGLKAANPDLTVVAVLGDGDGATIGGNHLLHSARRNIGVTTIVINNLNYGMTGGQYSGTTPVGSRTSTSFYGDPEPAMDLCAVVAAAGANYVARSTVYHVTQLQNFIETALEDDGFGFVEAVSTCPTYYGRFNGRMSPSDMLESLRQNAVLLGRGERAGHPGLGGKFDIGVFADRKMPGLCERYAEVRAKAVQAAEREAGTEACRTAPESTSDVYYEVVFAGSGGQGLGVAGLLLGEAAVEFDNKYSSQVQAYGVAARGGFAKSEVVISSREIKYPGVTRPHAVVVLTQEAYDRYSGRVPAGCVLLYDSCAVTRVAGRPGETGFPISAVAWEIGEPQSLNMVAMGVLIGITGMMSAGPVENALMARFKGRRGTLDAFRRGLGMAQREEVPPSV